MVPYSMPPQSSGTPEPTTHLPHPERARGRHRATLGVFLSLILARRPASLASGSACFGVLRRGAPVKRDRGTHDARGTSQSAPSCRTIEAAAVLQTVGARLARDRGQGALLQIPRRSTPRLAGWVDLVGGGWPIEPSQDPERRYRQKAVRRPPHQTSAFARNTRR